MRTYLVPRKSNNQNRILYFFTLKGFLYIIVGLVIGFVISFLIGLLINSVILKVIIIVLFAFIGFVAGEFKIPETNSTVLFKNTGGERIDDILTRWFKFRKNKKIYIYGKKD